jgi:hypothetical protein
MSAGKTTKKPAKKTKQKQVKTPGNPAKNPAKNPTKPFSWERAARGDSVAARAARELLGARARYERIKASRSYRGARRFVAPLLAHVRDAARIAVEARAAAERVAALPPSRIFRGLSAQLAREAAQRADRAEEAARLAAVVGDRALRRVVWLLRPEAAQAIEEGWIATGAKVLADVTPRGVGPGRFELQAEQGGQPLADPIGALFALGDVAQDVARRFPALRGEVPDGGILGRIRFEVRIDMTTTEAQEYVMSPRARLKQSYGVGYKQNPRWQRADKRLADGRFVPAWYDLRNAGAATLQAMGRIDDIERNGVPIVGVIGQALLGLFRTKKLARKSQNRYDALQRAGLTFGRGGRP